MAELKTAKNHKDAYDSGEYIRNDDEDDLEEDVLIQIKQKTKEQTKAYQSYYSTIKWKIRDKDQVRSELVERRRKLFTIIPYPTISQTIHQYQNNHKWKPIDQKTFQQYLQIDHKNQQVDDDDDNDDIDFGSLELAPPDEDVPRNNDGDVPSLTRNVTEDGPPSLARDVTQDVPPSFNREITKEASSSPVLQFTLLSPSPLPVVGSLRRADDSDDDVKMEDLVLAKKWEDKPIVIDSFLKDFHETQSKYQWKPIAPSEWQKYVSEYTPPPVVRIESISPKDQKAPLIRVETPDASEELIKKLAFRHAFENLKVVVSDFPMVERPWVVEGKREDAKWEDGNATAWASAYENKEELKNVINPALFEKLIGCYDREKFSVYYKERNEKIISKALREAGAPKYILQLIPERQREYPGSLFTMFYLFGEGEERVMRKREIFFYVLKSDEQRGGLSFTHYAYIGPDDRVKENSTLDDLYQYAIKLDNFRKSKQK